MTVVLLIGLLIGVGWSVSRNRATKPNMMVPEMKERFDRIHKPTLFVKH